MKFRKIFILIIPLICLAQWSTDPSENLLVNSWGTRTEACTDGDGGIYVVWQNHSQWLHVYVRRVDKFGYLQWNDYVDMGGEGNYQDWPKITQTGVGNAIVAFDDKYWEPDSISTYRPVVRVQLIDQDGNLPWGVNGVRVKPAESFQYLEGVTTDGQGGAFILFIDKEYYGDPGSLIIQRISFQGERMWGDDGIIILGPDTVIDGRLHGNKNRMISDGQGGAMLYHGDPEGETWYDWIVHRIDENGNTVWETHCDIRSINLWIPDGNGGCALAGYYDVLGNWTKQIVLNRIDSDGNYIWPRDSIIVADSLTWHTARTDITFRSDSSLIVFWTKIVDTISDADIFTQIIKHDSQFLFQEGGISLINTPGFRYSERVMSSKYNNAIYLWRNLDEPSQHYYGRKLNTMGTPTWSNDVLITNQNLIERDVISDGMGGGIYLFEGTGSPYGVFAQQISCNGILGEVATCIPIEGDVNLDGLVDIQDVIMCIDLILSILEPTEEQLMATDLDNDNLINIFDILLLVEIILEN